MNRKQKKAKRLNATAHTKKQATVYLTEKEEQDLWKAHYIDEIELEEISEESKRFTSIVKTVLYLMLFFPLAYMVWCNW